MNVRVDKEMKKKPRRVFIFVLAVLLAVWIGTLLHDMGAVEVEAAEIQKFQITVWEPRTTKSIVAHDYSTSWQEITYPDAKNLYFATGGNVSFVSGGKQYRYFNVPVKVVTNFKGE